VRWERAESSPALQHTVGGLAAGPAPRRIPRLLALVTSVALTGSNEASVRLKARQRSWAQGHCICIWSVSRVLCASARHHAHRRARRMRQLIAGVCMCVTAAAHFALCIPLSMLPGTPHQHAAGGPPQQKARASLCACPHAQDPTGAVGAGVTARGMDAHPGLAPGAAVLLRDVVVLRLGRVPYLAITPANVVKVLSPGQYYKQIMPSMGACICMSPSLVVMCVSMHCRPVDLPAHAVARSRSPDRTAPVATPRSCQHWSAGCARAAPMRPTPACGR
jgi:hypothetical protein